MSRVVLSAVSGDVEFLHRLRSGDFTARVHSVFQRVVNLSDAEGEIWTLAFSGLENAPNTLVLDGTSTRITVAPPGAAFSVTGTGLRGGNIQVDFSTATAERLRLPSLVPLLERGRDGLMGVTSTLGRVIRRHGTTGGIVPTLPARSPFEAECTRSLGRAVEQLMRALRAGTQFDAWPWGSRLIGLGPGLTPSGDDFITGLAAVCAAPGALCGHYQQWLAALVHTHRARTTDIGFATMQHAVRGRLRPSIAGVLGAMASPQTTKALEEAARRVTAIGRTSGTDILAGIRAGTHLERHLRGWT